MGRRIALILAVLALTGCVAPEIDVIPTATESRPPVFSSHLLLNGIPGDEYLSVAMRYLVDLRYRSADERGPWTGVYDPDGDVVEVVSVRTWMLLYGEWVEDAVFCPPYDGGIHACWRAGETTYIEPAFVLYPGTGRWTSDGVLVCPYPETGYASPFLGWYPMRSGEGCYSTWHPQTSYKIGVTATDGHSVVTHNYYLTMGASLGGNASIAREEM